MDHVIPRSRGGRSTWENVVTACYDCNAAKANKPLAQCGMTLLKQPRKPYIHPLKGRIKEVKPEWKQYLAGANL